MRERLFRFYFFHLFFQLLQSFHFFSHPFSDSEVTISPGWMLPHEILVCWYLVPRRYLLAKLRLSNRRRHSTPTPAFSNSEACLHWVEISNCKQAIKMCKLLTRPNARGSDVGRLREKNKITSYSLFVFDTTFFSSFGLPFETQTTSYDNACCHG